MRTVRELDLPLKQIKFFLENPGLDKNQLLSSQKRMLEHKKERLEGIISSIEDILKGDNKMDFSVFERSEIEQMYSDMESNMTDEQKDCFVKEYGKRLEQVTRKLAAKTGADVNMFKVKEIVGEMDFVSKQLYQMEDVSAFMLEMADKYVTDTEMQKRLDTVYGEGSTLFIGKALQVFYR